MNLFDTPYYSVFDMPRPSKKEELPYTMVLVSKKKQGRNTMCNCGSGKKYKKCCEGKDGD